MTVTAPTTLRVHPAPRIAPPPVEAEELTSLLREANRPTRRYLQPTIPWDGEGGDTDRFGVQDTAACDLPDATAWLHRISPMLLECLDGARPSSQLSHWVAHPLLQRISRRGSAARRRGTRTSPSRVLKVHVCAPTAHAVEASVVVQHAGRVRAMALRAEGRDGRWVVVALVLG